MRLRLAESLGDLISTAGSMDDMREALARASRDMGFDRFALSAELGLGSEYGASVLIHSYPASWADVYVGFNLAASDPVRRAGEHSILGFRWDRIADIIPMTDMERRTFETGRRHGIADGFTVPRHLPGSVTATCTFVTGTGRNFPRDNLVVAEAIAGVAIARVRQLSAWTAPPRRPRLTDRQRDCVLWAARGKTDWEISRILGIGHETVSLQRG
jgi:hypothetical protein